jgi:hypothetical protein
LIVIRLQGIATVDQALTKNQEQNAVARAVRQCANQLIV